MLTGKLFEYIVSGVPILAVGVDTKNSAGKLIEETKTGKSTLESEEIKELLVNIITNKCFDFYMPNIKEVKKYSRDIQAKKIIDISLGTNN